MELSPERERQLALIRDACKALFTEFPPAQHEDFIRLIRDRIIATPEKTTKAIIREEAKKGKAWRSATKGPMKAGTSFSALASTWVTSSSKVRIYLVTA